MKRNNFIYWMGMISAGGLFILFVPSLYFIKLYNPNIDLAIAPLIALIMAALSLASLLWLWDNDVDTIYSMGGYLKNEN